MAQVLVVDRAAWFQGDWPQGFVPVAAADRGAFLERALRTARFVERPLAETTPAWKQWIPYCALLCGTGDGQPDDAGVFLVRRTKGQSEARLHGAWSIGLGGHVEPEDATDPAADGVRFFAGALRRELAEELDLHDGDLGEPTFLGLLNDDSTEVGQVHAGLVYLATVRLPLAEARRRVGIREISKMAGGFTHLVEFFKLWQTPAQFETWSQVLIRAGIAGPTGGIRSGEAGGQTG